MSFWRLWFKGGFPVLRDLNIHAAIAAVDPLALVTVTVIIAVGTLGFFITEIYEFYFIIGDLGL